MANICPSAQLEVNVPELLNFLIENEVYRDDYENVIARILEEDVNYETAIKAVTANAEHIANRGVNINTVALWIVFCKYCSHRILSPYRSINYLLQKSEAFQSVHHVTFILCYTVLYNFFGLRCRFGRHRADVHRTSCGLRFATVGAKRTSTGCPAPLYFPLSEFVNTDGTT